METLGRFDIAEHSGVAMVVVEGDWLPPDPAAVVIPLLPDYPAGSRLNPVIRHDGRDLILATLLIAHVNGSQISGLRSKSRESR